MVYYNLLYLLFTYVLTRSPFNPIPHYERSTSIKESYGENYILPSWLGFFILLVWGYTNLYMYFSIYLYFLFIFGIFTVDIHLKSTTRRNRTKYIFNIFYE